MKLFVKSFDPQRKAGAVTLSDQPAAFQCGLIKKFNCIHILEYTLFKISFLSTLPLPPHALRLTMVEHPVQEQ